MSVSTCKAGITVMVSFTTETMTTAADPSNMTDPLTCNKFPCVCNFDGKNSAAWRIILPVKYDGSANGDSASRVNTA